MLEKVNNLEIAGGNARPLDSEERKAILERLQAQSSMTWAGVRRALAPLFKARSEPGAERRLKFNLEMGGDKSLPGNSIEKKLKDIFAKAWDNHPHKQAIRDTVPGRLWQADYREIGDRVIIRPAADRTRQRDAAARDFMHDFGATQEQAHQLAKLKVPTGWEPFSIDALRAFLPRLEESVRFGALLNGSEWEGWRNETFPNRERPTGEVRDRLPSPADIEEQKRIAALRNPTVARARNELRKVVNNLIDMFGKPDLIRVELAREVGRSKRDREEYHAAIRRQERRRKKATQHLMDNGIADPSRTDIEKWLLWQECGMQCPYTGDHICFDALFGVNPAFEIEHIWPRHRSLDNSFRNKTLCRRDENRKKADRTPYEYLGWKADRWSAVLDRLERMMKAGMSPGKVKRFKANSIPDDFAARQLNDTGYAAREVVSFLKRLWPDIGPQAPVTVQAVSGRVTGHLRRLWGLNRILDGDGRKSRDDHRHHAVDALVVACTHPGMTNQLSRYWQSMETGAERPELPRPWALIRADAEREVSSIVVSHRVRRKLSGPLHKDTIYGDTGEEEIGRRGSTYRFFVTREKVEELSKTKLEEEIRDDAVRDIVKAWVSKHGGEPKKAFPPYPLRGPKGPEIRRVRLRKKQQIGLMAKASTGYADLGNNHHIAVYQLPNGAVEYEVVSLLEASQRLARREPVVRRERGDGVRFIMSLSPGDTIEFSHNGETKARVVESVWSSGPIVIVDHEDATGKSRFRPGAKAIVSSGGRKVSVDPVGRIRPAND